MQRPRVAGDTALSDPTIFGFDPLLELDAVIAAQSHPLPALLRMFLSCGLGDLHAWQHAHADTTEELGACPGCPSLTSTRDSLTTAQKINKVNAGLDAAQLKCKIRLSPSPTSDSRTLDRSYAQA